MSTFILIPLALLAIVGYFVPTIIAINRNMAATVPLFLVNFFLGCTGIVWIVCLIWACEGRVKKT